MDSLFDDEHEAAGIPERTPRFVDHTGTGVEPPSPETVAELEAMRAGMVAGERSGGPKDSMMDEKYVPNYGRKIRRKKKGAETVG